MATTRAPGPRNRQIDPGHLTVGRQEVIRADEEAFVEIQFEVQLQLLAPAP